MGFQSATRGCVPKCTPSVSSVGATRRALFSEVWSVWRRKQEEKSWRGMRLKSMLDILRVMEMGLVESISNREENPTTACPSGRPSFFLDDTRRKVSFSVLLPMKAGMRKLEPQFWVRGR